MLFKALSKSVTAALAIEGNRSFHLGPGFGMKFEHPATGRHLHFPEGAKCVHALHRAGVYLLYSSQNLFPESGIESFSIRFIMNCGDEMLVHGNHLVHRELSDRALDFFCGYAHRSILSHAKRSCQRRVSETSETRISRNKKFLHDATEIPSDLRESRNIAANGKG